MYSFFHLDAIQNYLRHFKLCKTEALQKKWQLLSINYVSNDVSDQRELGRINYQKGTKVKVGKDILI